MVWRWCRHRLTTDEIVADFPELEPVDVRVALLFAAAAVASQRYRWHPTSESPRGHEYLFGSRLARSSLRPVTTSSPLAQLRTDPCRRASPSLIAPPRGFGSRCRPRHGELRGEARPSAPPPAVADSRRANALVVRLLRASTRSLATLRPASPATLDGKEELDGSGTPCPRANRGLPSPARRGRTLSPTSHPGIAPRPRSAPPRPR